MIEFRSGDPAGRGWHARLGDPVATHVATRVDEVGAVLARADAAGHEGRWAAVLVSYDAAEAFDPAMPRGDASARHFPLVWVAEFGSVSGSDPITQPTPPVPPAFPVFTPSMTREVFGALVRQAQEHIRAGDTYQVNLTFPLVSGAAPTDPAAWYEQLHRAQRAAYSAWLDMGRYLVISLSPELFFERCGTTIRTRPMKGTTRRGRWQAEDEALAGALQRSAKARAENVMIVDLLRNDIGRVAATGTVEVPELFTLERYPTLWQMTSTVEGRLRDGTSLRDIFGALFPCGSVTGAPKIRTMEVIAALEQQPRGLYTGAIGLVRPGGDCTFSVAIRTIVIDRQSATSTMGVGAGVTIDSDPHEEYDECLIKGAFAIPPDAAVGAPAHLREPCALLETLRLHAGEVIRLERHLRRMEQSALYFQYPWDTSRVRSLVEDARVGHPAGTWRMRLTVDAAGTPEVACSAHRDAPDAIWRVAFANAPVDDRDPRLFNKTTSRAPYDLARRGRPDVDDVLLWNARGEATESTIANLVVEIDGVRYTPPVTCGLLGGTLREELLERGDIRERVITRGEVIRAPRIWLINSLRGWMSPMLVR